MRRIEIDIKGKGSALAELDDRNPRIADELYSRLPIEAKISTWGDEIYFEIPLEMENENTSPESNRGDISYWSPGRAFCVFFGSTQPYSPVNHLGKVIEGLEIFGLAEDGDKVALNKRS
jgi:uncharacterized protein